MPIVDRLDEFISKIASPEIQAMVIFIKIPFILITAFFLGLMIFVMFRTYWIHVSFIEEFVEFFTFRPYGFQKAGKRWRRIMARLETGNEAEYKLAIIEADTILDENLTKMGMVGNTIDERVQKLTSFIIPNIEELQNVHQMRNNIVYDPDYRLSLMEARKALQAYEQTFQALDLL